MQQNSSTNTRMGNHRAGATVAFALITAAAFVLAEALIFRTDFYARFLEPSSSTGLFESVFRAERNRQPAGPNEILVMGDSRIGEGFSAPTANSACPGHEYYFASVAIPGTTPRCWYYLLRDLDPSRKRYRAIILPVTGYDDVDELEDQADRLADLHYVIARLRYSDIFDFARSFNSPKNRLEAIRGGLFKGIVFQSDMIAFMENTEKRLRAVRLDREHGWEWRNNYGGHSQALSGLSVDWQRKTIEFPASLTAPERDMLKRGIFDTVIPRQTGALARYRRLWFGRIIDMYRDSDTRLIFLSHPRGPAPPPSEALHPQNHSIRDFEKPGRVILLPETLFASIEKPDFYFDRLHLNSSGRKQFSIILAQEIPQVLGPGRD